MEFKLSDIIEHNPDGNVERMVSVGETGHNISFKVYQDIYHHITGKTEQISKKYSENLLIEFSDIEQLHIKIMQLREVVQVVACNETLTIFHSGERKEEFTSFERFKVYNSSSTNPTTSVYLKYNFSIILPDQDRPREYAIKIRIVSRVALAAQMENEVPPFVRGRLLGMITENTAEIKIEYSDYVVARHYMEAFDEWIKGCRRSEKHSILSTLQKYSHLFKTIIPASLVLLLLLLALGSTQKYFNPSAILETQARFLIMYSGAAYFIIVLGDILGKAMENAVDSYPILSFVKLNKGDDQLIEKFSGNRNSTIIKFTSSALLTVILGIISCKLDRLI